MNDSTQPKLRWYQFSLRTLLVFVTLCALPCSWLAVKMQHARKQRAAVEAIRKLDGTVVYDYEVNETITLPMRIANPVPPGPAWLRQLLGEDFFSEVIMVEYAPETEADLKLLNGLTDLKELTIRGEVTDTGLDCLDGLTQLRSLDLLSSQITDAGLKHLDGLTQLETLSLSGTQITDAGVEHLKALAQLDTLYLGGWPWGNQITDAELDRLKALRNLRRLILIDTNVTEEGLEKLRKALPKCKIEHQRHPFYPGLAMCE